MRRSAPLHDHGVAPPAAGGWPDAEPSASALDAYRAAFRAHTSAGWELVASGQHDLLRLLVGRVPADPGVGVILGLAVLFGEHPKGEDAGRALLATVLRDLAPARARTLLVTLADAWVSAETRSFDRRAPAIQNDLARAVRRLLTVAAPPAERDALGFIAEQLADIAPAPPATPEIVPRERHAAPDGFLRSARATGPEPS